MSSSTARAEYDDVAAMLEQSALLEKAGYVPYYLYRQKGTLQNLENIGWCKPGKECLYNIYIMEEVHSILSAGAGGSTKLVEPGRRHGKIERIFNFKYPTEYIDRFSTVLARKEGVQQFYETHRLKPPPPQAPGRVASSSRWPRVTPAAFVETCEQRYHDRLDGRGAESAGSRGADHHAHRAFGCRQNHHRPQSWPTASRPPAWRSAVMSLDEFFVGEGRYPQTARRFGRL